MEIRITHGSLSVDYVDAVKARPAELRLAWTPKGGLALGFSIPVLNLNEARTLSVALEDALGQLALRQG